MLKVGKETIQWKDHKTNVEMLRELTSLARPYLFFSFNLLRNSLKLL